MDEDGDERRDGDGDPGVPEGPELSTEEVQALIQEALEDAYFTMEAGDFAAAADALGWVLERWESLPPHLNLDDLILIMIRLLFLLGEFQEAISLMEEVDPAAVDDDPWRRAEFALHQVTSAQFRNDHAEMQKAVRAAIDPVKNSDDEGHHEALRVALAGVASAAYGGERQDLRTRVTQNLDEDGDEGRQRSLLELHQEVMRNPGSGDVERRLLDLATQHAAANDLWEAVAAYVLAGMTAAQRGDASGAARIATTGLDLVRDVEQAQAWPGVGQLKLLLAAAHSDGRAVDHYLRQGAASGSDLSAGHALAVRAAMLLLGENDAWAALGTALTAHRVLGDYQRSLPSSGERRGTDAYLAMAAGLAVRAANACADPRTIAEVIEVIRAQGRPAQAGEAGEANQPIWEALDLVGFDRVRPRWQTEGQDDPAILTGVPPVPRMPWGRVALADLQPVASGGQIVDIIVRRDG